MALHTAVHTHVLETGRYTNTSPVSAATGWCCSNCCLLRMGGGRCLLSLGAHVCVWLCSGRRLQCEGFGKKSVSGRRAAQPLKSLYIVINLLLLTRGFFITFIMVTCQHKSHHMLSTRARAKQKRPSTKCRGQVSGQVHTCEVFLNYKKQIHPPRSTLVLKNKLFSTFQGAFSICKRQIYQLPPRTPRVLRSELVQFPQERNLHKHRAHDSGQSTNV